MVTQNIENLIPYALAAGVGFLLGSMKDDCECHKPAQGSTGSPALVKTGADGTMGSLTDCVCSAEHIECCTEDHTDPSRIGPVGAKIPGPWDGCARLYAGRVAQQKQGTSGYHPGDWIDLGLWTVFDCGAGEQWVAGIVY